MNGQILLSFLSYPSGAGQSIFFHKSFSLVSPLEETVYTINPRTVFPKKPHSGPPAPGPPTRPVR